MTLDDILRYFHRLGASASAKVLGEPRCSWNITVDLSADGDWFLEIEVQDKPPHSVQNAYVYGPKKDDKKREPLEQVELGLQKGQRETHDRAELSYYWSNLGLTTKSREVSVIDQIGPIFGMALFISRDGQEWIHDPKYPRFGL